MGNRERLLLAAAILSSGWIALDTLFEPPGWGRNRRLQVDLESLQAANRQAEARAENLREQIAALRTRPEVQERVIRQELGFVRTGEIVLRLDP